MTIASRADPSAEKITKSGAGEEKSTEVQDLITISEAASMLGWSWFKASRAITRGELKAVKLPSGCRAVVRASAESLAAELQSNQK